MTRAIDCQAVANWNRCLAESLLLRAKEAGNAGNFDEVLEWCATLGWFASRKGWFGELNSRALELELLRAARSLPAPIRGEAPRPRQHWLHVLTEAYGTLGHTNLCRRWIQYDADAIHDIILTDQKGEAPANLVEAVKRSGGDCLVLDTTIPLLERARQLRAYAWQNSDVVALHIHPEDVVATTAFGIAGGPPVVFVNHADHSFWIGCVVADLIADIRPSGHEWTKTARDVPRAAILPLPLLQSQFSLHDANAPERRADARKKLGVASDEVLLLTVGSAAKFEPLPGINFVECAQKILAQCPKARLLAVGPPDQGAWREARLATRGRLTALGRQPNSLVFCEATDLYLEGFPAGSLTALLEAAEQGLPCLRAPGEVAPPFSSDGNALETLSQPANVEKYVQQAVALINSPQSRAALGRTLQASVRNWHCKEGWLTRLRELKSRLPKQHQVFPDFRPTPVDELRRDWLTRYVHAKTTSITAENIAEELFVEAWRRTRTTPQIDAQLWLNLNTGAARQINAVRPAHLRRLNSRIRHRGSRARFIANAMQALQGGMPNRARSLAWSCLAQNISALGDLAWLKILVKSHLSPKWLREFKRLKRGSA